MKYTSNFKVGSHSKVFIEKDQIRGHCSDKQDSNRITGRYFLYNTFVTLSNISNLSELGDTISVSNVSFFSKKQKTSHYTILRAPYRYKKGRYQVGFSRTKVNVSLDIVVANSPIQSNAFLSISQVLNVLPLLIDTLLIGGTNVITLNKVRLILPISSDNFFKIKNYQPTLH